MGTPQNRRVLTCGIRKAKSKGWETKIKLPTAQLDAASEMKPQVISLL